MNQAAARLHLGISTCPNDTFAFHAILNRLIDFEGLDFQVDLRDVEELNQGLLSGRYDLAKASFHAALMLASETVVMPSGAALGFGVGPVLLSYQSEESPAAMVQRKGGARVLCPGGLTTATLLYRMFHGVGEVEQAVFHEIIPRLTEGSADFGVCIHEGRFVYEQHGLFLVEDLGSTWEGRTGSPLPLGGIVARRELGADTLQRVQRVVRRSIDYACANRDETLPTMRRYAQEFSDDVLFAHVDLYVNDWTRQLGNVGRQALDQLSEIARDQQILPAESPGLEVMTFMERAQK